MLEQEAEWNSSSAAIRRERLIESCAGLIDASKRRVLVEAPAGYGKTTFVRQLLGSLARPSCLLALSPMDNDVVSCMERLCSHLGDALDGIEVAHLREMLTKGEVKPTEHRRFARMFTAALSALDTPVVLAFDDFHLVDDPFTLGFFHELLQDRSAKAVMLVASRQPVVTRFASTLSEHSLVRFDERDLAFSKPEIGELFSRLYGANFTRSQIVALSQRTGGWAMGVVLFGASVRDSDADLGVAPAVNSDEACRTRLDRYFHSQLMGNWSNEVVHCFCCLALLDEVPVELARSFAGPVGLPSLLAQCPFAVIDADTLRIHHLLQESLRSHADGTLTREVRNNVYRRAADWYAEHGIPETAIRYWLKAGELEAAHRALRETGFRLVHSNQLALLSRLLKAFPRPDADTAPGFWLFDGITRMYQDPQRGLKSLVMARETAAKDSVDELIALTSLIQFHFVFDSDFNRMELNAQRAERLYQLASEQLPPLVKCMAAYNISVGCLLVRSDIERTLHYSEEAMQLAERMGLENMRACIMTIRGLAHAFMGNYPAFVDQVERARPLFTSPRVTAEAKVILWLLRLCCCALCLADEFSYRREKQLAMAQFPDGLPEKTLFIPWVAVLDAQIDLREGEVERARSSIAIGQESTLINRQPHYRSILMHYQAVALAIAGDRDGAISAATESMELRHQSGGCFYTYQNQVTCGTAALLRHDPSTAIRLLEAALPVIRTVQDNQYLAAALIPLALARERMGDATERWRLPLEEALSTMRRQNYSTLWNWTPTLMRPALILAVQHGIEAEYARRLLSERLGLAVSADGEPIPLLRWRDLGDFEVVASASCVVGGTRITATQLRMLSLLLCAPGHRLRFEDVATALWGPDQEAPRNRVETVISRLRKTLTGALSEAGCGGRGQDYLVTDKQTVRLENCLVESQAFQHCADQGFRHLKAKRLWQAETALERACQYWKGDFCQFVDLPDSARYHQARLADRYGQVAATLAEILIESDELERARRVAEDAFRTNPAERTTARLLHDIWSRLGQPQKSDWVLQHYRVALHELGYSDDEVAEELEAFYDA